MKLLTLFFFFFFTFTKNVVATKTQFDFGTLTMSNMKLLGDAHMQNGSVYLTREVQVPYSGAGKFIYSKPIKLPTSFRTFFTFSVSNLNPSSIGGGLAFVISPKDDTLGDAGGFLGVLDEKGSQKGVFAIEFDTLLDVEFGDINDNHVGLDLGTMVSSHVGDLGNVGVDLKSGDLVSCWVEYDGLEKVVRVYVSYSSLVKPKEAVISSVLDLREFVRSDSVFVGFSGSTQGSTELHCIDWWSFSSEFDGDDDSHNSSEVSSPPPSTVGFVDPNGSSGKSPPSSENSVSNVTREVKNGKCHSQFCKDGAGAVVGVVTASAFFLAICALGLVWVYKKKFKTEKGRESLASDAMKMPKEFSYKELKLATRGFDSNRIIGHGAFGTVYKGVMPASGDFVAVKRCSHGDGEGKTEFLSELSIIATLRHRNLVRLQGWCHEKGEILLVYDLMSNGSLDKLLFESRMVLPWAHRRKVLLGVASALAYLHQECENQVIHRDVKSSNIMLDEWFNARLGDFGLARQIEHDKSPDATVAAGTMGYLAPEYLLTGRASEKTDVFSYGAVVLEVASGRRPIEREVFGVGRVGTCSNLVEWVWSLHREGRLMVAVDPRLGNDFEEVEMRKMLLMGLACSNPDPLARPTMRGVVQMLVGEAEVPVVPRIKPTLSFSTSDLLLTLQDSVSDLNGLITLSTSSSETSYTGGGTTTSGLDLV